MIDNNLTSEGIFKSELEKFLDMEWKRVTGDLESIENVSFEDINLLISTHMNIYDEESRRSRIAECYGKINLLQKAFKWYEVMTDPNID